MARVNAGYEIKDAVSISGKHYVMGQHQNPQAPAPFVTWETDDQQKYFYQGHYFTDQKDAQLDLLKRSSQAIDLGDQTIGKALLTQQDRLDLQMEFRNANALEDIAAALADEINYLGLNYDVDALMEDPSFIDQAMRMYDNQDHSYENEALRDALSPLLQEFPQHQITTEQLHAEVKIHPEANDLMKDLLTLSTAAVAEKYGMLGDNFEFDFDFDNGSCATLSLWPSYDDQNSMILSATKPHTIHVRLEDEEGHLIDTGEHDAAFRTPDENYGGIAGKYEVDSGDGTKLVLDLQVDETLRRTGNQFVYEAHAEDERYTQHDGEICTIKRALTPKECDILQVGFMWEAEFPNGDVLHVFDNELKCPEHSLTRKPPLSEKISSAQMKTSSPSLTGQEKEQER